MNVGHTSLPKAEPNFSLFGYPAYQPPGFVTHESKVKVDHHKQPSQSSGLIVNKSSSSDRDRDLVLSNPPPLISEMKNAGGGGGGSSVIVKHEVKSPHHLEPKVSVAHSPSPKLRGTDMMSHYIPTTAASQQHKAAGMYEYRSPTQSPHHLQHPHTPSPHHHMVEPQNLGKSHPPPSHHRSNSGSSSGGGSGGGQLPSPHAMHHRQSPHMHSQSSPHPSSAEARYRSAAAAADAQMYAAAAGGKSVMSSAYSYLPQTTMGGATVVPSHYALAVSSGAASTGSSSKPKVSSPAPPHIYGKPNAGIVTGIPVCRIQEVTPPSNPIPLTSKPPLPSSVSPSPYQQVSQYHPPHMHQSAMSAALPPPAHHSSRTTNIDPRAIYDRNIYASSTVPGGMSAKPLMQHHGTSPPTASAAPSPMSRSPHLTHNMPQMQMSMHPSPAVQTQPLDLGVSSDRSSNRDELSSSPKRKGTPLSHPIGGGGPLPLDVKKRRIESPSHIAVSAQTLSSMHGGNHPSGQPQLARVSEPSPLIASAATTITTVVNTAAYRTPANTIIISQSHPTVLNEHGHIPSTQQQQQHQQPAPTDMSHTSASVSSVPTISNVYTDSTSKLIVSTPPSTTSNNSTPSPVSVSVANNSSPVPVVISASTATVQVDQQPPSTPVKVALTPSVLDSEKSNSPGPTKTSTTTTSSSSSNYPVRHLKKAWLQRHTGEDVEDTTGVKGSGTCVTLPIPNVNHSNNTQAKETSTSSVPPVTSLHNIGSMAVNSINKTKTLSNKGNGRKGNSSKDTTGPLNGHGGTDPSKAADDSSSSDQERGRKSPPKRKPPKVKRKKGGGGGVKKTSADDSKKRKGGSVVPSSVASESGSDSDKESGSEKDSDSGASTNQASGAGTTASTASAAGGKKATNGGSTNTTSSSGSGASKDKEPRKRGRRPKSSKNDKGEEPRNKKSRDEPSLPQRDPFRKPPVGQLKKTGESFLQDGPCFEVAPKLAKCRECRWTPNQRSKNMPNIFCRFYAFRRLRYTKNGQLAIAGFSDPHKDASEVIIVEFHYMCTCTLCCLAICVRILID